MAADVVEPKRRARILVVEDDPSARMALEAILEALNYEIIVAENGHDAIAIYQTQGGSIDLIVSDLIMPQLTGYELYERLQGDFPNVRLLLMTGYPLDEDPGMLHDSGVRHWIQKPFTMKELEDRIEALLVES